MTTMRQAIRYLVSLYVKDLLFCLKPDPNEIKKTNTLKNINPSI